MDKIIWNKSKAQQHIETFCVEAYRIVEAQHINATRSLVDTDEEQEILEDLLENNKPTIELKNKTQYHYLLFSPFRYPPLPHGSRFASRFEPSLWYGSIELKTALAETAYYRLYFLNGTSAKLEIINSWFTSYQASIKTTRGLDLTKNVFNAYRNKLSSPTEYSYSQEFGQAMRAHFVEAFAFYSARSKSNGVNIGVYTLNAFSKKKPLTNSYQCWQSKTTPQGVDFIASGIKDSDSFYFNISDFIVDGTFPIPQT